MESFLISLLGFESVLKEEISRGSEIFIFHFEISGIIKSELHPLKILFISILLLNFHFEIFGIKVNDEQFSKILFKFYTFLVFHFEISGNSFNELHP